MRKDFAAVWGGDHVPTTGIITQLSTTDGKHLRAKMHICEPLCGYGGWWFSPRRHRQLVSYRDRNRRPPVWSSYPVVELARVSLLAPMQRQLEQNQQQR